MIKQLRRLSLSLGMDLSELIRYASGEEFLRGDRVRINSSKYYTELIGEEVEVIWVDNERKTLQVYAPIYDYIDVKFDEVELVSRPDAIKKELGEVANVEEIWKVKDSWQLNNYSDDDLLNFLRDVTPNFEDLSDDQVMLVENILKRLVENFEYIRADLWFKIVGNFLENYPEYINYNLLGWKVFNIITVGCFRKEKLLKQISEDFLIETWQKFYSEVPPTSIPGIGACFYEMDSIKAIMDYYPAFMETLIFVLADQYPIFYLEQNLDLFMKDKINKEDVIENLFRKSSVDFLEWPGSKNYPALERRAVYRLIFDARSGPEELAYFLSSPRQYYVKYSEWLQQAVDKFINKNYNLRYLDEEFLGTDLGVYMKDRMAQKSFESGNFKQFFYEGFHTTVSDEGLRGTDLGFKVAKKLLQTGNKEMIYRIFNDCFLLEYYPSLSEEFARITSDYSLPERLTSGYFDYLDQEEKEKPISRLEKEKQELENDPDYMEHFDKE